MIEDRIICTKRDFYDRARAGLCGNVPRVWWSVSDLKTARPAPRFFGVRFLTAANRSTSSALTKSEVLQRCRGFDEGSYVISESDGIGVDEQVAGLAGELTWVAGSWYLFYAMRLGWLRIRLSQHGEHLQGPSVLRLLRSSMCDGDYDHLMEVFDYYVVGHEYPVIEFSVLRSPIGPDRRCLAIWEIRHRY